MKNKLKVIKVDGCIEFEDGITLSSSHEQDCCEDHYLDFSDIQLSDFDGLEFDLSDNKFFKKVEGYGIELIPIKGHPIRIPGYGYNNGYYSDELTLVVDGGGLVSEYDISDCQVVDD